MSTLLLGSLAVVYAAILFALAAFVDRRAHRAVRWHRWTYPLALAVYCTSWTFFGAVGTAFGSGWPYLPIYLGPVLLFLFGARWLRRLVMASQAEGATSISDFLSARFSRSPAVAALVTLLMLAGTVPYLALQLRSISVTIGHLGSSGGDGAATTAIAAALLALFAIAFGTRRFDAAGRSDGLFVAVAAESLIKLVALVIVGIFAIMLITGLDPVELARGSGALAARFAPSALGADFLVITMLAATAMICLPRQFYVGVIEARAPEDPVKARWPLIAYMVVIALIALPITFAAWATGYAGAGDLIVVDLPLENGMATIALVAFVGGFSAATAMVVVETIALSTMVSNDLVAPMLLRTRRLAASRDIGGIMLAIRRLVIALLLGVAMVFALAIPPGAQLAGIGLIAFAAMIQIAPAMLLAVERGQRQPAAVLGGISAGGVVWFYTLFLPAIAPDWAAAMRGHWLAPEALFGIDGMSSIVHGTLFSLTANLLTHGLIAARGLRPRLSFDQPATPTAASAGSRAALHDLVSRFVGRQRTHDVLGPTDDSAIDALAARNAERLLSEVIGAANARALIRSVLSGSMLSLSDVARLLDHGGASLQFSRELLAATLENIDPGVSVIDRDLNLIAWNSRYLELFDYPPGMVEVGTPVADLIRHNALRGECGPGEVEEHVERRLVNMRRGQRHSFERIRPDGRVLKTVGGPMPGGGYVMCFTDVTAEAEARAAVEAARQHLERRVHERTTQLSSANAALAEATADKTRFLAAASHDLLQPLHAARLLCAALDRQADPQAQPIVDGIAQAIKAADETLRTLLDISKLDSGGITPVFEAVAVDPMLDELIASFAPLVKERGLTLTKVRTSAVVFTDRVLLRSVLQNFLSNAVRYTRQGGIVVGVRRAGSARVKLTVQDTGPGISARELDRLFREFERGRTQTEPGMGLGLAIVKRTARLLACELDVASVPGRGSRFGIIVPRAAQDAGIPVPDHAAQTPLAGAATATATGTLLIVDDDPAILTAMGHWAAARQISIRTHADADAALADSGAFDSALIDCDLGAGLDGISLAERLRARAPGARIAMITADRSEHLHARIARLDLPVFPKPVDPDALGRWLAGQTGPDNPSARAASAA